MTQPNQEKPDNTGDMQEIKRDDKGRFVEGFSGNPAGKIKGTRNFITEFTEAIKDENGDKIKELLEMAYRKAKNGDFRYWENITNRLFGKPKISEIQVDHSHYRI